MNLKQFRSGELVRTIDTYEVKPLDDSFDHQLSKTIAVYDSNLQFADRINSGTKRIVIEHLGSIYVKVLFDKGCYWIHVKFLESI